MSAETDALMASDELARETVATQLSKTLFVEAGAGTGKTTALVGRVRNLVLADDPSERRALSQIAAITFTEAAAAELRERVRMEFEVALADARHGSDEELITRCEEALADADIAAIQTLHGFAQRLLSEHPVELDMPPRVEVIDAVRSELAFDERWSAFLDSLYADPEIEEFIIRASILDVRLDGGELRNIAKTFDDNWDRLINIAPTHTLPTPLDFSSVHEAVHQIEALEAQCSNPEDKLLGKILECRESFARWKNAKTDRDRLRLVKVLQNLKFGTGGTKGNWGGDAGPAKETCKVLAEVCTTMLGQVANQTLAQFASRIAKFAVDSANERRAEGVLEFHDLLVLAEQLLRTSPEARASLSKRYRVVMLDEFQDTDPIQISVALLLASAIDGECPERWSELKAGAGRLFMVGDPKQSIYRFRRADIELFLQARDKFADGSVALQRNFRTVAPVIHAVNGLFDTLMAEDTRTQAKYSPLIPHRQPHAELDHRPLLLGGGRQEKAEALREEEARDVAAVIASIKDDPESWLIDDGNGGWKQPKLSDVTVLLPTRGSMKQLSAALDDQEIAFRADTGSLVYETQEVRDLLNVLRAIDDPSNEIATVAALLSPLYACGYDDLYAFASTGAKFSIDAVIPDEARGLLVAEGLEHLREFAARKWWDEPSELLVRLIDERFALSLPAEGRRPRDTWRRLRYVVDQARVFSEAGGGGLRSYLDWTDLQGSDGSEAHEPMLPEPDDISVKIMTIHGSKGLEFPITIVSGMTSSQGVRSRSGAVLWGEPAGLPQVRAKAGVCTTYFDVLNEIEQENEAPEKDRLLYVAFTRARDHLIVSGYHELKVDGSPKDSHGAKIHRWATSAGKDLMRVFTSPTQDELDERRSRVAVERGELLDELAAKAPDVVAHGEWVRTQQDRLARGSARSTISATGLAHAVANETPVHAGPATDLGSGSAGGFSPEDDDALADEEPESDDLPPRVFKRGRAGTAIGTAVHGVLQFLDLENVSDADIDTLADSQAWAESVPEHVETIRAAVRSVLEADIVKSCAHRKHHKELYVAAPVGSITVEGYVDLLVETSDGLVVVDYKTDSVHSEAEVDAKLAHYALQGTAYALAIESATGMDVCDVQFIFATPGGPIVRSVSDLDTQRAAVLAAVGKVSA